MNRSTDILRGAIAAAALVVPLLALPGCASARGWHGSPGVADAPSRPWTAPADMPRTPAAAGPATAGSPAPAQLPAPDATKPHGLAELIDIGLARNPQTRQAWFAARSAQAALGASRAALFPQVAADVSVGRARTAVGGGVVAEGTSYGPGLSLSFLLFDFGGRSANVEIARQALVAADWTHNAAIADRVLAITSAYRQHQGAIALAEAQRASVEQARANFDAAEARRAAGVATIADVLQAKTALSRAELALESDDGAVQTTRAQLNNAIGLPAAAPLTVDPLPGTPAAVEASRSVEDVIAQAAQRRPEIAAAEADVHRAEAAVTSARSAGLPSLIANGAVGRSYGTNPTNHADTYSALLTLNIPVFTGFAQSYNVRRAEEDLGATRARLDTLRQQVELEVFQTYQGVRTATDRVRTSADLVASAEKNQEVAQGRYKAGAGNILELLTAQSALADARAQDVQARADWLAALASLARATGTNVTPATAGKDGTR